MVVCFSKADTETSFKKISALFYENKIKYFFLNKTAIKINYSIIDVYDILIKLVIFSHIFKVKFVS